MRRLRNSQSKLNSEMKDRKRLEEELEDVYAILETEKEFPFDRRAFVEQWQVKAEEESAFGISESGYETRSELSATESAEQVAEKESGKHILCGDVAVLFVFCLSVFIYLFLGVGVLFKIYLYDVRSHLGSSWISYIHSLPMVHVHVIFKLNVALFILL